MMISCSFASQLSTPDLIVHAENLGFTRAWCYDCPARFSDIWVTMARAAERTSSIGLGTSVIVPSYREVMTAASSIATLEALAPGRVAIGIGTGLGQASQGRKRTKLADLEPYVIALRGLLRGEEVSYQGVKLKMMQDPEDIVESVKDVPLLLASEGPKTLAIAEEHCDGVLSLWAPKPEQDWSAIIVNGTVVEDDDPNADAHVMAHAAPGAAIAYHASLHMGGEDAAKMLPGWDAFKARVDAGPEDRRHLTTWSKHVTGVTEDEAAVLTPETVRQLTFTGSRSALRERLHAIKEAGATEVIYQVAGPDRMGELERFAEMAEPYM